MFPLSICLGNSKPENLDFLRDNIDELKNVLDSEVVVNDRHFQVELMSVVCDAPARAMVKNVKQFSGYFSCDKCTQEGMWQQRMTFPQIDDLELRTDSSFREQSQPQHHKGITPF